MVQIVICDMDGTVIGKDERLPAGLSELIKRLSSQGILFTFATGRSESFMNPLIESLGLEIPYVASNGAAIIRGKHVLMRKQFNVSHIRTIVEKAQEMGMSIVYTSCGVERVTELTPWLEKDGAKRGVIYTADPFTEDDWRQYSVEKVLIMDEIRDGRIGIIEKMCESENDGSYSFVRYRDKAIEIMEKSANKATGIENMLGKLGIPVSEALFIGDDDNDREMFQLGGIAVAVGNASKNVLQYVDYHCCGHQFAGVCEAVAKYCDL